MKKILVTEDQPNWQRSLQAMLQPLGYGLHIVGSCEAAVALLEQGIIDLVIANVNLLDDPAIPHDQVGLVLLQLIKDKYPHLPRIVITGDPSGPVLSSYVPLGVDEVLIKGHFTALELREAIQRALDKRNDTPLKANIRLLIQSLPTGIMHLFSHDDLPLLEFDITNRANAPLSVIVSSFIEQFSDRRTDTVQLEPGQRQIIRQLPTLRLDQIASIREVRKATLHTRVAYLERGQERTWLEQDYNVQFLARDALLWAIIAAPDFVLDLSYHIAAWVTPNAEAVIDMLRHAAAHMPSGQLWGYQAMPTTTPEERAAITRSQVQAIFQALKEQGRITYINSPISFGQKANEVQQRVNLPQDSLRFRQANCLDGAVLYASLIERAAMNPVIILIPQHAFVGWETWEGSGQYEFLETTMTGSHTFQEAFNEGMQRFSDVRGWVGRPLFDPDGYAIILNIKALHQGGILPAG